MNLAKRIRDLRYAKGWGPDELANRAKISRTALYQIERGNTSKPQAGTLRRISRALGVPLEILLDSTPLLADGGDVEESRRRLRFPRRFRICPREASVRFRASEPRSCRRSFGCSWVRPWLTGSPGSSKSRSDSCRSFRPRRPARPAGMSRPWTLKRRDGTAGVPPNPVGMIGGSLWRFQLVPGSRIFRGSMV